MAGKYNKRKRKWIHRRRGPRWIHGVTKKCINPFKPSAHKELQKIGLVADPNKRSILNLHHQRVNKVRSMYLRSIGETNTKKNIEKSVALRQSAEAAKFEYDPTDLNAFIEKKSQKKKRPPLIRNLPNTPMKHLLNVYINHKPETEQNPLSRYKKEYYQRLINRYGRNYDAMQNDISLNFFQWTACQIKGDIEYWRKEFNFKNKIKRGKKL